MKPIRTVIVDDEPLARENLMLRLRDLAGVEVLAECGSGREALQALEEHQPDVLFLDIQMPDLDGFEVVDRIPVDQMPVIIFVTAFDRYALEAFKVHASDYLLKPFSDQRFETAWAHAREQVLRLRQNGNHPHPFADRLVVKTDGRITFLKVADIDWIEANGDYAKIHCEQRSYLLRKSLNELATRLGNHGFLRISRSVVVNPERVCELVPMKRGEYQVELHGGAHLKLTRSYHSQLEILIGDPL
jgi:two-component system, LytTR family, response regulator